MLKLSAFVLLSSAVLYIVRKYQEHKWGRCRHAIVLSRKIVIVTGANSGIGYQIAKELARRHAHVIVVCRTLDKAVHTIQSIKKELSNKAYLTLTPMAVELTNFKSIENFCKQVSDSYPTVDILINNAGCSYPSHTKHETDDGLEIHFGVNYLAQFYLTKLLLDKFQPYSRIIIIASSLFEKGTLNVDGLNTWSPKAKLYANSKLACIYFSQELAKRTKDRHINVYAVCPGWVYTNLFRHSIKWYHYIVVAPIAYFFMRSAHQGCQTPLHCAMEPRLDEETGLIYRDCKHYTPKMKLQDEIGPKLWEKSEAIIESITKNQ